MRNSKIRTTIAVLVAAFAVVIAVESAVPADAQARPKRIGQTMKKCTVQFDGSGDVTLNHGQTHTVQEGGGVTTKYWCFDGFVCYQTTNGAGQEIDSHCYNSPARTAQRTRKRAGSLAASDSQLRRGCWRKRIGNRWVLVCRR